MDFTEQKQIAADQVGNHWYYRAKFALLRKSLAHAGAFRTSSRLADVGCGLGVFLTKREKAGRMAGSQMVWSDP